MLKWREKEVCEWRHFAGDAYALNGAIHAGRSRSRRLGHAGAKRHVCTPMEAQVQHGLVWSAFKGPEVLGMYQTWLRKGSRDDPFSQSEEIPQLALYGSGFRGFAPGRGRRGGGWK